MTLTIGLMLKLVGAVILTGYFIYSILLSLRVRILADSVKTPFNGTMRFLSTLHVIMVLIGGAISILLILVA